MTEEILIVEMCFCCSKICTVNAIKYERERKDIQTNGCTNRLCYIFFAITIGQIQ